MGCCWSICPSSDEINATGQFESLVVPKAPVGIVEIAPENSDSDRPLFGPASSDDDTVEVSDMEILPDSDGKEEG
jgi:hypothetical protein